jgi:large subunit ribosomal protein L30
MSKVKVKLIRSGIHCPERQKKTLRALGLNRMNKTVEHENNAQISGMLTKVKHLVSIENI